MAWAVSSISFVSATNWNLHKTLNNYLNPLILERTEFELIIFYEFGTYCMRLIPRVQNLCVVLVVIQNNSTRLISLVCIYDDCFERPATASKTSHGHKNFKCQTVWSTPDQSLNSKNLKCRGRETFLFSFNYVNLSCHHEDLVR